MADKADIEFMRRALELAGRGRGFTKPNPLVGAVLVKNGRIIAEGFHKKAGADHAEVVAIKKAGSDARRATLYVTLEPCCHWGRTGPCCEAILAAGIKRVVYAAKDPDPRVSGKGARRLKQAGLQIDSGILKDEAIALNEAYYHHNLSGKPFVILKTAQSLDGRIATATGHSQWISGEAARKYVHQLRADVDAVVVGSGTACADNPALTVRHAKGMNPYRIIVSRNLSLTADLKVLSENNDFRTILVSTDEAIERFSRETKAQGLIYWAIELGDDGLLDLDDFLHQAGVFGLRSLLVEGGSKLATSFLSRRLVDKCIVVVAPMIVGRGIDAVGDLHIKTLDQAIMFSQHRIELCGEDSLFIGYPVGTK